MTTMPRGLRVLPAFGESEDPNKFVERVGGYSGMSSLFVASRRLLRRPNTAMDGMPNGLQEFHDVLGHFYGPLEKLKTDHTLWRLYCCGLPEESYDAQWNRLLYKLPGPVHMTRAPVLYGVGALVNRQCPICEEISLKAGFTYFHRRLAVPYASICAIHKVLLRVVGEQQRLFDQQCSGASNADQFEMAWQLSVRIEYCLNTPPELSKFNKKAVIASLKVSGWIGENSRLRLQLLLDTFATYFDGAFADARLALLCQSTEHITNALRALLRPDHAVFPIWCVLFVWFAEQCPCPVAHVIRQAVPNDSLSKPPREPTCMELKEALKEHVSLKATALALHMPEQTLAALCRRFNLPVKWRAKKIDANLRAEIYKALKEGMRAADVTERFCISLTTLYREMKVWPDLFLPGKRKQLEHIEQARQVWTLLQEAHPEMPETSLRKMQPAAWAVLYRHDRSRLVARRPTVLKKTPRREKTYHPDLLDMLNSSLAAAASSFSDVNTVPGRKSAYSLRKMVGITESQYLTVSEKSLVDDHEESREAFIERRLAHAKNNGASPSLPSWQFAKAAGLRAETIQRHMKSQGK
jgi:hypothetical protein